MNIYLEHRKNDIKAFEKAIKYCEKDAKTVKILKKYLREIEDEYSYADYLETSFMPLISNKDNFYRAFIFRREDGDYSIEVYVKNISDDIKKEYVDIYNKFYHYNNTFFDFKVLDIKKDKYEYDEANQYDKITITANKK